MSSLFGRPMLVTDRGFSYTVHDRDTGLEFAAVSEDGGAVFRGAAKDAKRLRPVLAAFDALLDKTPAAECRLELPAGDGKLVVIGVKNGAAFEELASREPLDPPSAQRRSIRPSTR